MTTRLSLVLSFIFLVVFLTVPPSANADRTLFTVSNPANGGPNLRVINPLNGATIATIPITLSGFSVLGSTGLARDPTTGTLYALFAAVLMRTFSEISGRSYKSTIELLRDEEFQRLKIAEINECGALHSYLEPHQNLH